MYNKAQRHEYYLLHRAEILAKKKSDYKPHPKPVFPVEFGKKRCSHCHHEKDATAMFFSRSRNTADGLYNECKVCVREKNARTREHVFARHKEWDAQNPSSAKRWRRRVRLEMVAAYGGKCACCGEHREPFLTLDHIGGRTLENHPWRANSGSSIYAKLKKLGWPKDHYRLLCMNCNFAIRWGDPCPHELEQGNKRAGLRV